MQENAPTRVLRNAIARLPRWQQAAIAALVLIIALTWLATCVVLASYVVP